MIHRRNPLLDGIAMLLDQQLGAFLPARYAAYRPLVASGLHFFLGRLDPARLAALVDEQLELPAAANTGERIVALMHHCPTLHKLGQLLARDRRLDPELRCRLQTLESTPPPAGSAPIHPSIRRELGGKAEIRLGATLAAGSVALVVPFTTRRTDCPTGEGVIKVLKPGIEAKLAEDLEVWAALADFLEERCAALGLVAPRLRELFDSVRSLLAQEVRLDTEQARLAAAGHRYRDSPKLRIPALLPLSTPRLIAMERIRGVKLTEPAGLTSPARRQLAATAIEALLAQPFFGAAEAAVFHADPHGGNLFRTEDGRLAILDWSLTTELSRKQREALLQIVLAALAQDAVGLCRALAGLGCRVRDQNALREVAEQALGEVRRGRFPGLEWGLALLDRLAARAASGFPGELVLLRKALLALQGVLADLDPGCAVDLQLAGHACHRLIAELPARLSGTDPGGGFPLDSAQLLARGLDLPAAALRYWQGQWCDWAGLWYPFLAIGRREHPWPVEAG